MTHTALLSDISRTSFLIQMLVSIGTFPTVTLNSYVKCSIQSFFKGSGVSLDKNVSKRKDVGMRAIGCNYCDHVLFDTHHTGG